MRADLVEFHLLDAGCLRFNELHRRVPGITARLLTKQLRDLEEAGLVSRTVYAEVQPRVEYRVSEEGESLRPIVKMLSKWGEARLERQGTKHAATHARRTVSRHP
jgi:DNA-binding HxlR family transcriptional regulator